MIHHCSQCRTLIYWHLCLKTVARRASRQRAVLKTFACPRLTAYLLQPTPRCDHATLKRFESGREPRRKLFKLTKRTLPEPKLEPQYEKVGRITHFYSKASVAVVELSAPLNKGDKITIRGSTTNIEQTVDSMETEHKQIPTAQAGQLVGMKVAGRVRENDIVYRIKVTA